MRRALPPLWLAQPSRYAAVSPGTARLLLAGIVAVLLLTLLALAPSDPVAADLGGADALSATITDGVRAGGNYYAVVANALRAGGYPLKPFLVFPLPTQTLVEAALPPPLVTTLLCALLGGVLAAWHVRLRPVLRHAGARMAALLLLAGGAVAAWRTETAGGHAVSAGLLIALSLARWRPQRWAEAVGWGLVAAVTCAMALPYLLIMAVFAWRDGDRRQAAGWAGGLLVLALLLAVHAWAVAQVVGLLDPSVPAWTGLVSPELVARTTAAAALGWSPFVLAAPLIALALFGWTAWADPLAARIVTALAVYALLLAIAGQGTGASAALIAPVLPIALAFAPDGLRDLIAAALDTRRIVVRRLNS